MMRAALMATILCASLAAPSRSAPAARQARTPNVAPAARQGVGVPAARPARPAPPPAVTVETARRRGAKGCPSCGASPSYPGTAAPPAPAAPRPCPCPSPAPGKQPEQAPRPRPNDKPAPAPAKPGNGSPGVNAYDHGAEKATCRFNQGANACTATVLDQRTKSGGYYVVTASHCCPVNGPGVITVGQRRYRVDFHARDQRADLAVYRLELPKGDPAPPTCRLARSSPSVNDAVYHRGLGVDRPGNREDGRVNGPLTPERQLPFLLSVSSGDSGSGIFSARTGELVGVVCCTRQVWGERLIRTYGGSSLRVAEMIR